MMLEDIDAEVAAGCNSDIKTAHYFPLIPRCRQVSL